MQVVRERPSQRLHHRVTAPLTLSIDGQYFDVIDWSLGGFCASGIETQGLQVGDQLSIKATVPFQGFDISFEAKLELRRIDHKAQQVAGVFSDLDARASELLSHYVDELVRGSMVSIGDTIQRIDTPVTPVSTKPDPNPLADIPLRRWPIKTVIMSSFYLLLGLFIFSYAMLLAYTNIYLLEVDSAVVSAPVEVLKARVDGDLILTDLKPGDRIVKGMVLAELVDPKLQQDISEARLKIISATAEIASLDEHIASARERARDQEIVGRNNVIRRQAQLRSQEQQLRLARVELDRLETLLAKGLTTISKRDLAAREVEALSATVDELRIDLQELEEVSIKSNGDNFFESARLATEIDRLMADRQKAVASLEVAERNVELLEGLLDRQIIRAPFNGKFLEFLRVDGASVNRKDEIALIEKDDELEVLAFLTQDEILSVGLHDKASVFVPALSQDFPATVQIIDRTEGFLKAESARYSWRAPRDRSAMVRLRLDQSVGHPKLADVVAGMPAIVILHQRQKSVLMQTASNWLSPFTAHAGESN